MYISTESILVILVVGVVAGWLAGKLVRGSGFGLLGDLVVGVLGAFVASLLFPRLGIHLGNHVIVRNEELRPRQDFTGRGRRQRQVGQIADPECEEDCDQYQATELGILLESLSSSRMW